MRSDWEEVNEPWKLSQTACSYHISLMLAYKSLLMATHVGEQVSSQSWVTRSLTFWVILSALTARKGIVIAMQMLPWTTFNTVSVNLHIKGAVQGRCGFMGASDGNGGCSFPELSHVLAAVGHLWKTSGEIIGLDRCWGHTTQTLFSHEQWVFSKPCDVSSFTQS